MTDLSITPTNDLQRRRAVYLWLTVAALAAWLALAVLVVRSNHESDCRAKALGAQVSGASIPARDRC